MIDKSLVRFLMIMLASGGIVILAITWIRTMPLSDRIASTLLGTALIVIVLIWALASRAKSAKVRVTIPQDKNNINRETF